MKVNIRLLLTAFLPIVACTSKSKQQAEHPTVVQPSASLPISPLTAAPTVPRIPTDTTAVLNALIKKTYTGYEVEEVKVGDLNDDGQKDLIVLARTVQPCEPVAGETFCRKALLVLNEGFPRLRIAAANDNVVECTTCGGGGVGDPYQGIVIIRRLLFFRKSIRRL